MNDQGSNKELGTKTWLERLSRVLSAEPSSRNELIDLLRDAEQRQVLDSEALSIIEGALQVSDMRAGEIMIPRSQVVMVRLDMQPDEFLPLVIESGHSRFPVINDGPDDIVGILLAKDLLSLALSDNGSPRFNLKDSLRRATAVPESKRLNILLQEFRATRNHMAIVRDEYGGVAGIVTIEDVLEQIVGEIEDEYDVEEEASIKMHRDNTYTIKALTPIEDFNEHFNSRFSEKQFETIGGIVTQSFGHLPRRDEAIDIDGFYFKVLNSDNRRINLLHLTLPGKGEGD